VGESQGGFARLLGRGDPARTEVAAGRLEVMHGELAGVPTAELEAARAEQVAQWQARLEDLLEEHSGLAAELRVLVDQVRADLPAGAVTASGHGVAAGRDVSITALAGGVAAATTRRRCGRVRAAGRAAGRPGPARYPGSGRSGACGADGPARRVAADSRQRRGRGMVRPVLPPTGNGQVIATTRSARWPVARAVEVPVVDRNVAAGLLLGGGVGEHAAR
jgi:hypothetical protein